MRTLSLIGLLTLLTAGCGGIDVRQDYDPAVDLAALGSFSWRPEGPEPTGNALADSPLLHSRIRAAVERGLLAKGHRKAEANPDYLVTYSYTIQDRSGHDPDTNVGVGVGGGSRGSFGSIGIGVNLGNPDRAQETLVIDMLNPANGDLLWRGLARQRLARDSDPEQTSARINETVAAILARFPPQKKN